MSSKPRRRLFRIGLSSISFMIGALLLESALRTVLPIQRLRFVYGRSRDVYQYDPQRVEFCPKLGFRPLKSIVRRFENWEFRTTVETNSGGYRDDEGSLDDPGIIISGDSYFFGWGVEKSDSIEAALEESTGLRVLNISCPGYGTAQELIGLAELETRMSLTGRIVILSMFHNDFADNDGYGFNVYPVLDVLDGEEVLTCPSASDFKSFLSRVNREMNRGLVRHSVLVDQVVRATQKLREWLGSTPRPEPIPGRPVLHATITPMERFLRLATRLAQQSQRSGFRLLFVFVPIRPESNANEGGAMDRASKIFEDLEIPTVDLRGRMPPTDYFAIDDHWRPSGHRRAASIVVDQLREKGWLHGRAKSVQTH